MTDNTHQGHRERLRQRFLENDHVDEEMILELLLAFAIARKDVRPLAQELIRVFGDLSKVLSASPEDLYNVQGIGQSSVVLLKVAACITSGAISAEPSPPPEGAPAGQLGFLDIKPDGATPRSSSSRTRRTRPDEKNESDDPVADTGLRPSGSSRGSEEVSVQKSGRRKLQVCRSHILEFNHFSRILSYLYEQRGAARIGRDILVETSGLPDGQVASLISIGSAMGLIHSGSQILTPIGSIIAEHDIFLEQHGTLEWCHYKGASSYQNLIWYELFNNLLAEESAMSQEEWQEYFVNNLKGRYTYQTIHDHVPKEIRFIVDAYTNGHFRKLELLHLSSDDRFYRRRYTRFAPVILSAMIYDFCARHKSNLYQVGEMAVAPGSPSAAFGLDVGTFRNHIEGLHERGWLRYETTHNLDQIRLKPDFSVPEFLAAYFEDREPRSVSSQSQGGVFE